MLGTALVPRNGPRYSNTSDNFQYQKWLKLERYRRWKIFSDS
jgi:hypothetical protein